MTIDWHYPRRELTDQFLTTFESGVSNTLTLFAPRRMGKTEFILYDLIPAAEKTGYRPIYVSFWEIPNDPSECLRLGLDRAIKDMSWLEKRRSAQTRVDKVRVGGGMGPTEGFTAAAEVGLTPNEPDTQTLGQIRHSFEGLAKSRRNNKILLCLDEVQHLATDRAFEPLVFFLRTLLDENRDSLRIVFTGSSRDGLQRLFNRRKAPLFRSSSQVDLPDLGSGFVRHMLSAFDKATARTIDFTNALNAFYLLNRVPRDFRAVIEHMVLSGETDITTVTEGYRRLSVDESEFQRIWSKLKPIDQALLTWIARDRGGPYQEEGRDYIAQWLGMEKSALQTHAIQNSLNRLRGSYLAPVEQGIWVYEDQDFKNWVMEAFNDIDTVEQPQDGSDWD